MAIYTYKITFLDGCYYYGKRKCKHEDPLMDRYYGTPVTHKEKWNIMMYSKEIIKEYDDWIECSKDEIELIRPHLNNEKCLNENCGGYSSLEVLRRNGANAGKKQSIDIKRKNGLKARDQKLGMFSMSTEERKELSKKLGMQQLKEKKGIHSQTIEDRRKLGEYCRDNKIGFHSMSKEERIETQKRLKEEKRGLYGLTKSQLSAKNKKAALTRNKQKWKCTITGHISNPTGLSKFQNNRNIDTTNRIRIK